MFWLLFIVTLVTAAWLLRRIRRLLAIGLIAGASTLLVPASAQHAIDWYSVSNGAGRSVHPGGLERLDDGPLVAAATALERIPFPSPCPDPGAPK